MEKWKLQWKEHYILLPYPKTSQPSVRCFFIKLGYRNTETCNLSSKRRSQWRTKPTPLLLSQHTSHVGRPSHYHSPHSPAKSRVPTEKLSKKLFVNCKARKTLFGALRKKPALGCQSCWTVKTVLVQHIPLQQVKTKCLWRRLPGADQSIHLVE